MTIDGRTLSRWETIYTFVAADGSNVHIHTERLHLHLQSLPPDKRPKVQMVELSYELAQKFIHTNVVAIERVRQLDIRNLQDPIVFCSDGTSTDGRKNCMLVDGHHRFTRAAIDGYQLIPSYVLDPLEWEPFRVTGIPDLTRDELLSMPNLVRSYHK